MKRCKGTTLLEVMVGASLLAIVSLFVYTGILIATNFIREGTDLQGAETAAAAALEQSLSKHLRTDTVELPVTITNSAGNAREILLAAEKCAGSDIDNRVTFFCYQPLQKGEEAAP